jgi:hypothetical protein
VREIMLDKSSGEPPLPVYDTTGPYTDNDVAIDVEKGLSRARTEWVKERGGVEEYDGRVIQAVDNGNVSGKHAAREYPTTHRPLRGLPGNPDLGALVCIEIDATKPENMRPCDTRGGLGDSLSGLIWGGSFLTPALLGLWARHEFAWGFDWRGEYRRPVRPHPSTLRRKPTRRDRKRARKAQQQADDEFYV